MSNTSEALADSAAVRTFLIADIRGYTRFTVSHGDEATSRLAKKFAAVMAEGIEAWGGRLVELRGDEALAVFSSPRAALRAAVELQDAFADETLAEPDLPLAVGMGLDAGEAVSVGDGFRGAALNIAARLCAGASAGEIRVTESLTHLAGSMPDLEFEPLDPVVLKGIDGTVTPWLVGTSAPPAGPRNTPPEPRKDRAPLPPELESLIPIAGREADLRWLGWHWRRARRGHSRTVGIMGPTGIGKTRLAAEMARLALRDGSEVRYLAGGDLTPDIWREEPASTAPLLLVIDDLDEASVLALEAMAERGHPPPGVGTLLLAVVRVPSQVEDELERLSPDGRRALGRLDAEAVRAIAGFYAEHAVDDLPLDRIEEESNGVPAAVHRVASQLARAGAAQRLGTSAERAAIDRRGLRAAEEDVIREMAGLELATRRARLTTAEDAPISDRSATICPYKGLATFEAEDAAYFFGRERVVAELIARLVGSPFVAVVGASGSGKSSALRAGLMPALASGVLPGSDTWTTVLMRPGERPMSELRVALGRTLGADEPRDVVASLEQQLADQSPGQRLLLIVDQFEEVFASADADGRHAFLELLTTPRSGLKVIVAVRADQYGQGAAYPALARQLAADHVLVGPVTPAETAEIVEQPAQQVGLRVEPGLTEALVRDAGEEPGALPLLSTALLELWQAREDGRLTLAAYNARGGLRGAVARLAESAFARLTPEQEPITRSVMLRLAGAGEGDTLVRRRVPIGEFDTDTSPGVAAVLDTLTTQRLLTMGDGYIEVAHEALLREWPRLQGWLDEDASGRRLRLHLIGAAREWDERGREPSDLYRGARLAAMLDWAGEHDAELNATERNFVAASREAAEDEANRQRATNRRLRLLLAGAGVFLVAAVAAGGLALLQRQEAVAEAARADAEAARASSEQEAAEEAEAVARSRELAASAISYLDDDPSLSTLLALSAATIADPPIETVSALHQAWAADRIVDRYAWPDDQDTNDVAVVLSPDGRLVAASGDTHYLEVVDWRTDEVIWAYDPETDDAWVSHPYFTRDGASIVASVLYAPPPDGDPEPPVGLVGLHFWDAETGQLERTIDIGRCGAFLVGLGDTHAVIEAPAGEAPCTEFDAPAIDIVLLQTGERTRLTEVGGQVEGGQAAMSADGGRVTYSDFAGGEALSYVVDTATGERLLTIDPNDDSRGQMDAGSRAMNDDGSLLVYGDRPIQVWDVDAGEVISSFGGHAGESNGVAFGFDGESIFSTGRDSALRLWDARSGDEIEAFRAIGSGRVSVDGSGHAVVGRQEGEAVIVDLRPRAEVLAIPTCAGFVPAFQLGAAGGVAAMSVIGCEGNPSTGSSLVADLGSGEVIVSESGALGQDHTLAPDGTRFVRQEGENPIYGPLTIRDARTGDVIVELEGMCTWNQHIFLDSGENPPGCNEAPEPPFPFYAFELRWSPDGTMVAGVGGAGGLAFGVWDAVTGELLMAEAFAAGSAIFTPDGREIIIASGDERVGAEDGGVHLVRFDVESGDEIQNVALDDVHEMSFIGFSADGATLFIHDAPASFESGTLRAVSADGFEVVRSRPRVSDGSVKSNSLSGDGTRIALGSSDGFVRVWDAATFALVHEIFVGDTQVQGVAWVSDTQLAVAPEEGDIIVYTTDVGELLTIVRESVTRGFTEAECERFNFGNDCPSLESLRAGD